MKEWVCGLSQLQTRIAVGDSASAPVAVRKAAAPWSCVARDAGQGGEAAPGSAHIAGSDYIAPLGVDSRVTNYAVDSTKERRGGPYQVVGRCHLKKCVQPSLLVTAALEEGLVASQVGRKTNS